MTPRSLSSPPPPFRWGILSVAPRNAHLHGIPARLRKHEAGHGMMGVPRGALVTSTASVWLKKRDAMESAEDEHVQFSYFGLPSASFFLLSLTFFIYLCQSTVTPSLLSARVRLWGIDSCLPAVHTLVWPRITLLVPAPPAVVVIFCYSIWTLVYCSAVQRSRREDKRTVFDAIDASRPFWTRATATKELRLFASRRRRERNPYESCQS